MNKIYSNLLGDIAIFGGVNQDTIHFILSKATLVNKKASQYFFNENDIAENMYILTSGEVEIVKVRDGNTYTISTLHKGECFGEMALLDHYPRSASVRCSQNSAALQIDIDCFEKLYQRDIKQFAILQMNLGREVCRRLREANELLFENEIDNPMSSFIGVKSL